jgi:hypothetical protein
LELELVQELQELQKLQQQWQEVCKCTKSPTYYQEFENSEPDGDANKLPALLQEQPELLQKQLEIEIAESGGSLNSHECGRTADVDAATNRKAADKKRNVDSATNYH